MRNRGTQAITEGGAGRRPFLRTNPAKQDGELHEDVTQAFGKWVSSMCPGSTGTGWRLINDAAGGNIDISQITGASISVGSVEGGGTLKLGGKNLLISGGTDVTFSGVIQDGGIGGGTGGILTKLGGGVLTLSGNNTYTGGTVINSGVVSVSSDANLGTGAVGLGSVLQFTNAKDIDFSHSITLLGSGQIYLQGASVNLNGAITGAGSLTVDGTGGSATLRSVNTYTGATIVASNGFLVVDGKITQSASLDNHGFFIVNGIGSAIFGSATNRGTVINLGFYQDDLTNTGTFTNSGTFVGNVNNSGTFINNGSVSGAINVTAGGTLAGTGSVGSLVFASAAAYLVTITGTTATSTTVTGTATLGGTVVANATSHISATTTYNILTAGTVSGTFCREAGGFGRPITIGKIGVKRRRLNEMAILGGARASMVIAGREPAN